MNEPTVIVFAPGPMIRLGGTNIWEGIVPTLRAESHGGDAQPYIAIFFDGYNQKAWEDITVPLRTNHDGGDCVFIIDGTRVNDVRVYDDEITPCLKSRMGTGGNNVPFVTQETTHDVIGTIQARSHKGPNHENARDGQLVIQGEPTMQVRRLTPIECERLMGWPDDHTLPRADGKTNSDTTRYKMCGNGVASPVAEWIGRQIIAATE